MENEFKKVTTTPKDFFLEIGLVITLYASIIALLALLFHVVDLTFPDPVSGRFGYGYYDPYSPGVRMAIATLLVIFPIHLWVSRLQSREEAAFPEKKNLFARRWITHLTLFVAGIAVAVDLIVIINAFLGGEMTARFVTKALAVLVVAALTFGYYYRDIRGGMSSALRRSFAIGSIIVVVASIVGGVYLIGSPTKHRSLRFDSQKVSDLQGIQGQIVEYYQVKRELPKSLSDLRNSINYYNEIPVDPQSGESYRYVVDGPLAFQLCADFNLETPKEYRPYSRYYGRYYDSEINYPSPGGILSSDWKHEDGVSCFKRTIDPDYFPPINQPTPTKAIY